MLTPIDPVSIWISSGTKTTLVSVEGASRFLVTDWPAEQSTQYYAALKACLAALEGVGTAEQARAAVTEAAKAAGILAQ